MGEQQRQRRKYKKEANWCYWLYSRDKLRIGSVKKYADKIIEWVLDSCSNVHVCNQQNILTNLSKDQEYLFQSYDGKVGDDEQTGNVHLGAVNSKQQHQEM
ncbi:unnamed protein product [Phytophthora fragariaefolia]|uniref:Unnamed protein product n=1 Tax=Phytophthora fragariaefolia TaxID=1490495 RepID=A0A9W6XKI0_9STRA|nr:unnamed protein product [Phytophthora fragariaefolia]